MSFLGIYSYIVFNVVVLKKICEIGKGNKFIFYSKN